MLRKKKKKKKKKETGISMRVFFIFCMRLQLQARSSGQKIPEWKLKAKLARNIIFESNRTKFLSILGQNSKSDNFRGFYFNWSVFKSHT